MQWSNHRQRNHEERVNIVVNYCPDSVEHKIYFASADLPTEIVQEIFSRVDVIDIISLQLVNKTWCEILRSQKLWREKCQQYWPNYPLHAISDYFTFFLKRGGVYFVRSVEHLKRIATNNKPNPYIIYIKNRHTLPNGVVLLFEKSEKKNREPASKEFWSKAAVKFKDGSNLVLAPKYLEDEDYDYILVENSVTDRLCAMYDNPLYSKLPLFSSEEKIVKVLLQIMNALKHLDEQNIIANWGEDAFVVDICGDWFEIKMDKYAERYARKTLDPSTPNVSFMSPEYQIGKATVQSHMWNLGIMAYTLLTGKPPFYDENQDWTGEYFAILEGEYSWPETILITTLAKDFVDHLILVDPLQRLTLNEAFEHPWIKNSNALN